MVRTLKGKVVTTPRKTPLNPITQADIDWFEAHEGRVFHLRDPAPLEFKDPLGDPGDGFSWRVLVVKLSDGGRLKLPAVAGLGPAQRPRQGHAPEADLRPGGAGQGQGAAEIGPGTPGDTRMGVSPIVILA